jgi:hypothetical protein
VLGPLRDASTLTKFGAVTDLGLDLYRIDAAAEEPPKSR